MVAPGNYRQCCRGVAGTRAGIRRSVDWRAEAMKTLSAPVGGISRPGESIRCRNWGSTLLFQVGDQLMLLMTKSLLPNTP